MRRSLAALAALTLALPTSAYVLTGDDWTWQTDPIADPFDVNSASFPASAGPNAQVRQALIDAMDVWTDQGGADFSYTYGTATTDTSWDPADGANILQWHVSTTQPTAVALAQTWVASGSETVECDIRFFGANGTGAITWSSDPSGAPAGEMDLTRIAVHELGHCLGLNHSGNAAAIMFNSSLPGTGPQRDLHNDDKRGVQAIYGLPKPELIYAAHAIDDDVPGPSQGDGDGIVEVGERIELDVDVENVGDVLAPGVQVDITSSSADVIVVTSSASVGNIAVGATETTASSLLYRVRFVCSADHTATFDLTFTDSNGDSWTDSFDEDIVCDPDNDGDGFVASADCDDADPDINDDADEIWYDGVDQDCDGASDYDQDGDGHDRDTDGGDDCDDDQATVYDGATEMCDGLDNDCDGSIDEGPTPDGTRYYKDVDGDGYGTPDTSRKRCSQPNGFVDNDGDCDDDDEDIHPGVAEICDGVDEDCNGIVDDDGTGKLWYADSDGDGFGDADVVKDQCTRPAGYVRNTADCLDSDSSVNPDGSERCNGLDDDCDGEVDNGFSPDGTVYFADGDGDGFGDPDKTRKRCTPPLGYVDNNGDCDDADLAVNPDAVEVCDGEDEDCDGTVDDDPSDGSTWYPDGDGDGHGVSVGASVACTSPLGTSSVDDDCDDGDERVYPGAPERCNGLDDDCNGGLGAPEADADNDGVMACAGDCDDGDAFTQPGATEICDGLDNDCNLSVDDGAEAVPWYRDGDGDGAGDPTDTVSSCEPVDGYVLSADDCDDSDEDVAAAPTWFGDGDDDGYGDPGVTTDACDRPSGFVDNALDCDDDASGRNPDAEERCDGSDTNCNGQVDEGGDVIWYADLDGDGYGDAADSLAECDDVDRAQNAEDCDDGDADVNPGAAEVPYDGVDNDCDGEDSCDGDGDGHDALSCGGDDCDDGNDLVYPGASEYLDDRDNDCDGLIDNQGGEDTDVRPDDTGIVNPSDCACNSGSDPVGGLPLLAVWLVARRRRSTAESG